MNAEVLIHLQDFIAKLNKEPDESFIELTPDGKAKTVVVSAIEAKLDELFFGLWSTQNFSTKQILNEMVGELELVLIHPITGQEIRRVGAASIQITQDKDARVEDFLSTKKKNALDLTYPKLKAECLKNAAQSLGKVFGRDLNRKIKSDVKKSIIKIDEKIFENFISRIKAGETHLIERIEKNFILTEKQKEKMYENRISFK